jgi:hypothetical protein
MVATSNQDKPRLPAMGLAQCCVPPYTPTETYLLQISEMRKLRHNTSSVRNRMRLAVWHSQHYMPPYTPTETYLLRISEMHKLRNNPTTSSVRNRMRLAIWHSQHYMPPYIPGETCLLRISGTHIVSNSPLQWSPLRTRMSHVYQ